MAAPRVLVLDCYNRMGLAVVNSLDRRYELVGGFAGRPGLERFLRSPRLTGVFRYPRPAVDFPGFAEAVLAACARFRADAVFPCSTATVVGLSRLREQASTDTAFVVERWDKLSVLADKWSTYGLALELGLPTPRTALGEPGAADDFAFPVVAKPRLAEAAHGVRFFADRGDLDRFLEQRRREVRDEPDYVVQEVVDGLIHDAAACTSDGTPVVEHTVARVLTRYDFGGPGLVNELTFEPDLLAHAARVFRHLDWNGPGLLEFIRDETGKAFLIEANPRVWGSVELTVAAGLNVPQLAFEILALGTKPEPRSGYQVGYQARWLTAGSIARCFKTPRQPSAVARRLWLLTGPRGQPTVTNLRRGNLRHLTGMAIDNAFQRRDGGPPGGARAVGTPGSL